MQPETVSDKFHLFGDYLRFIKVMPARQYCLRMYATRTGQHKEKETMRIFVTGATGFVGSTIVQELIGAQTQQQLGWRPTHLSLIADIDRPSYFEA